MHLRWNCIYPFSHFRKFECLKTDTFNHKISSGQMKPVQCSTAMVDFTKKCVRFDIPRSVNNCSNSILDKINTHSLQGFSGYIKTNYLQCYQENYTIMDCYVCKNYTWDLTNFYLTCDWHIFSMYVSQK